ncbi:hypothetical protein CHS0354_000382 [Potamilus streckersoni]|uniref:Uncharacterized protein n=1 Tax=Potamilus streckersoni TaxID=2493646 RepID=A0AAE0SMC8_9BIVA|nr:hypothetical protein CHS0354_000382 [Potamilus streckersoni]
MQAPAPVATVSKSEISSPAHIDALASTTMISAASDALPPMLAGDDASSLLTSSMSEPTTSIMKTAETPQQTNVHHDISEAQEQLLALLHLEEKGLIYEELKEKMKSAKLNQKQKKLKLKQMCLEATRQCECCLKVSKI